MNKSASPRDIYSERLARRGESLKELMRRRDRIGYPRLAAVLAAAAVIWYAFHGFSLWWIAAPVAIFIALAFWQSRVEREAECMRRAIRFYEQGVARLEHRWQGNGESGARFSDPHHPYASDLDLFGRASLFELLSIARTRGGEARLAAWLKSASSVAELSARHEAINELRPMLDLREQLAILGDDFRAGVNPEGLVRWAGEPAQPFPVWRRVVALLLSAAGLTALLWWLGMDLGSAPARIAVIAVAAIEGLFGYGMRARILHIVSAVEEPAHDLGLLAEILATLEKRQFESLRLKSLRDAITVTAEPASHHIARLRRLMEMLESRENPLVHALGPLVLWTTQIGMAVEKWHAESGPRVAAWLDAVSEIEALSSLANYAWEHPDDPFPTFAEGALFEGESMGHPLLPEDRCVRNSVTLEDPLRLLVVSGSNMSGKSTLLRTIGVNAVLALAGAPVRAKRLRISHLSLGASIRTTDSLEEGHSRFMAEILRLKQVLELPSPAMFLLDELLHGTNSHDRALGSEGLTRALLARGAIGLITTHDLSLARVADELGAAAANVHFEDRLEDGRLVFDFRIRPGVVERSNALDLMRAVGLDV
jgi:membrane protein YdbS with pleckstrin-like domain